jgi:hypothetical protein
VPGNDFRNRTCVCAKFCVEHNVRRQQQLAVHAPPYPTGHAKASWANKSKCQINNPTRDCVACRTPSYRYLHLFLLTALWVGSFVPSFSSLPSSSIFFLSFPLELSKEKVVGRQAILVCNGVRSYTHICLMHAIVLYLFKDIVVRLVRF